MSSMMGQPTPDTPGWVAYKIVSGALDLPEKMIALKQLADQFPNDETVTGYFESLAMQQDLEDRNRARPVEES
jgi:hypothetical protein